MSKLSEWGRRLWLEAELAAPPTIQRLVVPRLHDAKDMVRLLFKPYLTVWQWQGQNAGGPMVVNYAGSGQAKAFLKNLLFTDKPTEKKMGRISIWHPDELTSRITGDITIIEANKCVIKRLSSPNALILPVFLSMILDVQGDWQQVKGRLRKGVRSELRLTRKYNYEYEVSRGEQDFETFYDEMYLPTMKIRHADQASPVSRGEAFQYFQHGLLFFVTREGQRVAGSVCQIEQDLLHFRLMGVIGGDEQLMREGIVGALNYLRIQWASKNNYKGIDFGWYRPFMTNLFRNKRKWGTTATIPTNVNSRFWFKLQQNTPAVVHLMSNLSFIIVKGDDQLYGLVTTTDEHEPMTAEKEVYWRKQCETPGLKGLLIRSPEDFFGSTDITEINGPNSIIF